MRSMRRKNDICIKYYQVIQAMCLSGEEFASIILKAIREDDKDKIRYENLDENMKRKLQKWEEEKETEYQRLATQNSVLEVVYSMIIGQVRHSTKAFNDLRQRLNDKGDDNTDIELKKALEEKERAQQELEKALREKETAQQELEKALAGTTPTETAQHDWRDDIKEESEEDDELQKWYTPYKDNHVEIKKTKEIIEEIKECGTSIEELEQYMNDFPNQYALPFNTDTIDEVAEKLYNDKEAGKWPKKEPTIDPLADDGNLPF